MVVLQQRYTVWFIDSLVNGNPNELRAFALALRAKKIPMRWTRVMHVVTDVWTKNTLETYPARVDVLFNYGIESGSQRVLDDMAKGVIDQRDGRQL